MNLVLAALAITGFVVPLVAGAEDVDAEVIIVGGGPAAIQAAATLIENGCEDFIILAESDQLRGYLEPIEFCGITFAPGSLFGYTPIKTKLDDLGVDYVDVDNYDYTAYNDAGDNVTEELAQSEYEWFSSVFYGYGDIIEDLDKNVKPDISVKAATARGGFVPNSAVDKLAEWWNVDWFGGLPASETSTINSYRQAPLYPDSYFILDERTLAYPLLYDQEDAISQSTGTVVYDESVRVVNQTAEDCVTVVTESGNSYIGEYVILTNTVGVLQSGRITFDPHLPPWKYEELCRWPMDTVEPIFLKFPEKFWDDTAWILHASEICGYYPAFLNLEAEGYYPEGTNILIGFVAGDEAYRVERLSDEEVQAEITEVLRNIYGGGVPDPDEIYVSRFITDVNHFGLFTQWPIGTLPEDGQTRLRAHIGRVYFAPEDAADEYLGIPFGSINDGVASALSVVGCKQNGTCDEYTPIDSTLPQCRLAKSPGKFRKND